MLRMRAWSALGLTALLLGSAVPQARAWDDFGHMEVAAVAFKSLGPRTRDRVAQLLKLNPRYASWIAGGRRGERDRVAFLRAATWADSIKSDGGYTRDDPGAPTASRNIGYGDLLRHDYWHFVDLPFSPDGTPLMQPRVPNAATQLPILAAALGAPDASEEVKSYDLVWLLHLVGDLHQPLHCVSRFDASDPNGDRGGNHVKIVGNSLPPICDDLRRCSLGPPADLHTFFDVVMGSSSAIRSVDTAVAGLPRASPSLATIRDHLVWIQEGLDLARSQIYVRPIGIGDGPFTVIPAYQEAATRLARDRIALAGARLANLLNDRLGR